AWLLRRADLSLILRHVPARANYHAGTDIQRTCRRRCLLRYLRLPATPAPAPLVCRVVDLCRAGLSGEKHSWVGLSGRPSVTIGNLLSRSADSISDRAA